MTVIGGTLETKEIGLLIGTSGTHYNTELDESNRLRLKIVNVDGSGKSVYSDEGYWISNVVNLGDKFKDFEKVFTTHQDVSNSSFAIQTRVSDNGIDWSDWVAVAYDGTIQSETKQYIQVKINLFAGFETDVYLISDFKNVDDVSLFDNNSFISTSDGLRLKRKYEYDMSLDATWIGEGSLHRKAITRDEWLRIDRLEVVM